MNQSNYLQYLSDSIGSNFLFIIPLNDSDYTILLYTLRMEYGKRRSQAHPRKYNWLGPDPTQNTQGRRYPYITGGFNNSDLYGT